MEEYANPRTVLSVTLIKTFLMEASVIGIIVGFWVTFRGASQVGSLQASYLTYRSSKKVWEELFFECCSVCIAVD